MEIFPSKFLTFHFNLFPGQKNTPFGRINPVQGEALFPLSAFPKNMLMILPPLFT